MNLVNWTPMRELQRIQKYLNRTFGDMPLRRIDDDGFSLLDWALPVDVEETGNESSIKARFPEIKREDVKVEMLNRADDRGRAQTGDRTV